MSSVIVRNNVKIIGHGRETIIFAHGFCCDQQSWKLITPAFLSDYRVVLFDYVGSGNSDRNAYSSERYASLDGYVQDLLDIAEALDLKECIFVGHSISSMIGLLAAIRQPGYFGKMVFIAPSPCYVNDQDYTGGFEESDLQDLFEFMESNYFGWSRALAPAIMGNNDRPELGKLVTESFCAADPEIAREFARVTFLSDTRKYLHRLAVKSLTLQCREDMIAPLSVGFYLKENIPHNTLLILNTTGHYPHISNPEETIYAIKAFIA